MTRALAVPLIVAGVVSTACRQQADGRFTPADSMQLAMRHERLARALATVNTLGGENKPLARWILPRELGEISGLALTADGRLLAHNDERGVVTVIDPRRGVVLKRFTIGKDASIARADFEGITVANGTIYMVASNGTLYEFIEGSNGARVSYAVHDTKLGHECEFEGVAFDRSIASLILPCKVVGKKSLRDQLVIYRWTLHRRDSPRLSMITVPLAQAIGSNGWKGLHPSDVSIDPRSGNYVLVASREHALVEITPNGDVVQSIPLPGQHNQAEGVAITEDGILVVSDEATNHSATLTLYRWPRTAASRPPT